MEKVQHIKRLLTDQGISAVGRRSFNERYILDFKVVEDSEDVIKISYPSLGTTFRVQV